MINPDFSSFPLLETQRLILREICENDIEFLFKLRSNPTVMKYIGKHPMRNIHEAIEMYELIKNNQKENKGITWVIELKKTKTVIGNIAIWRIDAEHHRGELGYMLLPEYFNQGYMNESLHVVLQYGFHTINLHSFEANINPFNTDSKRLLEKNNFVKEAHFKENYFFNGQFEDSAIYSLLRHQF